MTRHNPNVPDLPGPPETTTTEPGQQSFVRPLASEPNPIPPPVALDVSGKIGQTVFQRTIPWISHYEHGTEKILQRRRHVVPFDPKTHLQLLNRARFAAAVRSWKLLTPADQAEYNRQGNAKHNRIEGLNLWIRRFIQEHNPSEFQADALMRDLQADLPFSPT